MLLVSVVDTLNFKFTPVPNLGVSNIGDTGGSLYFTITSVDENYKHRVARKLSGRKVKLTLELVEEENDAA
jgi:hypothetical protein